MTIRMPAGWLSKPTPVQAKAAVTARVNMSAEVVGAKNCPCCAKPMVAKAVNMQRGNDLVTIPSLACMACRVVLPVKDDDADNEQ